MLRCHLAEGLAFHADQPALISTARKRLGRKPRRVGHNLLLRLQTRKADVLRFLSDPAVPFTKQPGGTGWSDDESAAENLRRLPLIQRHRGVIRSLISTARKQGWDILRALAGQPDNRAAKLRLA
jgi:transposase